MFSENLEYVCFEEGPGRYFIGDICYALLEEIYDKIWGDEFCYDEGQYPGFAVAGTM